MSLVGQSDNTFSRLSGVPNFSETTTYGSNALSVLGNMSRAISGTVKKVMLVGLLLSSMIDSASAPSFRSFPVSTFVNGSNSLINRNIVNMTKNVIIQPQCAVSEYDWTPRLIAPISTPQINASDLFNLSHCENVNDFSFSPLTIYQDLFPNLNVTGQCMANVIAVADSLPSAPVVLRQDLFPKLNVTGQCIANVTAVADSLPSAPIVLRQDPFHKLGEFRTLRLIVEPYSRAVNASNSPKPMNDVVPEYKEQTFPAGNLNKPAVCDVAVSDVFGHSFKLLGKFTYDAAIAILTSGSDELYYAGFGVYKVAEVVSTLLTPIHYFQSQNIFTRYIVKGIFFHQAARLHHYYYPDELTYYDELLRINFRNLI